MVDEVKEFPPVITSSDQPEKEAEKNLVLTNDKKSEVSSQLGPPKPMKFGASSTPVSQGVHRIPNSISAAIVKLANDK